MTSQATDTRKSLPLADLHRRLGAVLAPLDDLAEAPAAYTDEEVERQVLESACGLVDRSWMGRLEIAGADRQRFLNGQVTCDVKTLEPGRSTYGFFVSPKGRVVADATILALAESHLLELPPATAGPIRERLEKYILVDRVEVSSCEDRVLVSLVGPRAEPISSRLAPLPEVPGGHSEEEVLGVPVRLVRRPLWGLDAVSLWVPAAAAAELFEELLEHGRQEGLALVGFRALEIARIERGVPRFGPDFGPDHFPQETGLDEAVSYTKGCYLGQEVVARIHYRGQVNRALVGLLYEGEAPPPGAVLLHEGREAGRAGSAVRSAALGAVVGLAVLHRRAAEPGTVLALEGGGTAEVRPLPFR